MSPMSATCVMRRVLKLVTFLILAFSCPVWKTSLKDDAAYLCTSANSDDICMLRPDCVSSMEGPTLKDDDNNQYAVTTQNPIHTQSVHPLLAMYVSDLPSSSLNWSQLQDLLNPENDLPLFDFLTSHGLIASSQQCEFCGGQ